MKKIILLSILLTITFSNFSFSQGYELWGWGTNFYGEIGDGTNTERDNPIQNGKAINWNQLSSGNSHHNLAIKTDSSLWAWGHNDYGQLGDSSLNDRNRPTRIGLGKDWKFVCAGFEHTIALKVDGSLWAWGRNTWGELGDNSNIDKVSPVQIGADKDWKLIATGDSYSYGIKNDGSLWAWGVNQSGELGDGTNIDKNNPTQIGTNKDWKNISAGSGVTIAIKTDGSLWAWGWNLYGQIGDGTNIDKNTPTHIGNGTDWKEIYANAYHCIATKTDGSLWTWGYNNNGQLGDGTKVDKNTPTHIGSGTDWAFVSGGLDHSSALKTDGTLWTWGINSDGQLGDGTNVDKNTPTQIGKIFDWKFISGGAAHSLALKSVSATYIASGLVKNELNNPVQNVTLTLSNGSATFTNSGGIYTFSNLNNGTYVITPRTSASYTYSPTSRTITISNGNITSGIDFTAIEIKYNISGTIKDEQAQGVGNITLNLSGGSTTTTLSSNSGTYSFTNLSLGTYIVTPQSNSSYTFTPVSRTITINGFNSTANVNFTLVTLKYSLSGKIKDESNNTMNNMVLNLSGSSNTATTNTLITGAYNFNNLINGTYVITPQSNSSYTFSPTSRTVTINGANISIGLDFVAIELKYNLSGLIKDEQNVGVANVALNLSGSSVTTTNSIVGGNYSIANLKNGFYVITPQATNSYTFSPISKTISINNGNISSGLDFVLITTTIPTYSISGNIKDEQNNPISNITLSIIGSLNTLTNTILNGTYKFSNLANGVYIITPQANSSYTFSPESRTVTINNSNINTGLDFVGIANLQTKYNLAGQIIDQKSNVVPNITLSLTGASSTTTKTIINGIYTFNNLSNGTYIITPQANSSFTFSPVSKTITINNSDITSNLDFIAIPRASTAISISGYIRNSNNIGIANLSVNLEGNLVLNSTSSANGKYSFTNLTNGIYEIIPQATSSYTFSPESRTITLNDSSITSGLDFTQVLINQTTYSITSQVVDENGIGISNVLLNLTGNSNTTTNSITGGTYNFTNLTNGKYIITPQATSSYTFTPVSRTITISDASLIGGMDFVAVQNTNIKSYSISGIIKDEQNVGVANITINLTGFSSTSTNSIVGGNYSFSNLSNGTYIITPQALSSYTFSPVSRTITINNANILSGLTFTWIKILSSVEDNLIDINTIKCSPNPTNDLCHLEFNNLFESKLEINLYSNTGSQITSLFTGTSLIGLNNFNFNLNNYNLSSGVYLLEFNNNGVKTYKSIIFEK